MKDIILPFEEHATSPYLCVSFAVIDKLQQVYFSGGDLAHSVPDPTKGVVLDASACRAVEAI
jgi:hypothetical protein